MSTQSHDRQISTTVETTPQFQSHLSFAEMSSIGLQPNVLDNDENSPTQSHPPEESNLAQVDAKEMLHA